MKQVLPRFLRPATLAWQGRDVLLLFFLAADEDTIRDGIGDLHFFFEVERVGVEDFLFRSFLSSSSSVLDLVVVERDLDLEVREAGFERFSSPLRDRNLALSSARS